MSIEIKRGQSPVLLSLPHTGTQIPDDIRPSLRDPWLSTKDTDWWIDKLYEFALDLDITTVRTPFSRTVIDVNRDPSGASLYPGQITTGLCPLMTFEDEPLYHEGLEPNPDEIERRKSLYFTPYHQAIEAELTRLKSIHPKIVLYDAHAIRSNLPRLFEGQLPQFNIGDNSGQACNSVLTTAITDHCAASGQSYVVNGRFKGGWITRHYGRPSDNIHAIQMELCFRGYMDEPSAPVSPDNWPTPYNQDRAVVMSTTLKAILKSAIEFAKI